MKDVFYMLSIIKCVEEIRLKLWIKLGVTGILGQKLRASEFVDYEF